MAVAQQATNRSADSWVFDLSEISFLGKNLRRPECVLSTASGDLFVAALGQGVVHISPQGDQHPIGAVRAVEGKDFIPNGLTLEPDGSFLVTNMGEAGGLWKLNRNGAIEPVLREVDGQVLSATNFVLRDWQGRLWLTISTRQWPISRAFSPLARPGHGGRLSRRYRRARRAHCRRQPGIRQRGPARSERSRTLCRRDLCAPHIEVRRRRSQQSKQPQELDGIRSRQFPGRHRFRLGRLPMGREHDQQPTVPCRP